MPNIFPQISFFTAGLSNLLIAFSPQKVKKMVTFFPVAAAPFASTKVAKTLSRSSLNRIKVFPLSSRQTSEEEDCGVLFSTITSYFPAPDFTETKRFPVVWHHASASRGKPASVATISRRSPSASSSILFFSFMIGPGQDMPQASTFIAFIEGMTEEAIV